MKTGSQERLLGAAGCGGAVAGGEAEPPPHGPFRTKATAAPNTTIVATAISRRLISNDDSRGQASSM
jgi:hypothetical protein